MGRREAIAIGLALVITLASARASAQSERYDAVIAQAVDAFEHERYIEARRLFTEADALMPSPRTLRGIGLCALELGDYASAYHQLSAALAMPGGDNPLTPALRTQVEEMVARARAHVGIYGGLPADATLRIGEAPVGVEPDGTVALAEGERIVTIRLADGRETLLTLEVQGGATATFPDLAPSTAATTTTTTTTDAHELAAPRDTGAPASDLTVVEDDHTTVAPPPPERTFALELTLSLRGGSRNSGTAAPLPMSGCFGAALTGALLTRVAPGLWVGGALALEYAWLTETDTSSFTAMLVNSAQTRGWFEGDLHFVVHYLLADAPLVLAASIGPASVLRDRTSIDAVTLERTNTPSNVFGGSLTASARLRFADDRMFVGVEVHGVASDYPGVELGLVIGGAPL